MSDMFISLSEASELENIKYNSMKSRFNRNPDKFITKKEKQESGGKDLVLVSVSSLSGEAQRVWKERQKLKEEVGDLTTEQMEEEAVPWYVDVDVGWFMEAHKKEWYEAMELGNVIRELLRYEGKGRTEYAAQLAKERLNKGVRTIQRYEKAYLEAKAWADKLSKEDGSSYDYLMILSLCRKPKESGNFPSFTSEVKQAIKNIWFNKDFAANQGTREMLYDKLKQLQVINNWGKIPSYQSVVRYISYLMEDCGMKNAWYLASHGTREYKNKVMTKARMDTTVLKPMEVVMGDEHTFDCWVSYRFPNGTVKPIRPVLVAWIDVRSRRILGDIVCHHANSDILKESLIKLINTPDCGVPQYLLIDNGKDYTAEIMTGVPRNMRNTKDDELVDISSGFYTKLGIEDVHRALPYQPWTKGNIERFFGGVCSRFSKQFKSYTGTLTGSKTDAKIPKNIQEMFENGELLTLEEFYAEWSKWLVDKYENHIHQGLKEAGEMYKKPIELFDHVEHYYKPAPPKAAQLLLMYKEDNVRIYNYGFKRFGKYYNHPELQTYINQKVSIRYDKNAIETIFVIDSDGRTICEAESQELLAFGSHVSEELLIKHNKAQAQQLKRDRAIVEEANIPFEDLVEGNVGFNSSVGGIDLMIGHKKTKKNNVVSMPLDPAYRNGLRGKSDEDIEENEYFRKNAEEVLSIFRAQ